MDLEVGPARYSPPITLHQAPNNVQSLQEGNPVVLVPLGVCVYATPCSSHSTMPNTHPRGYSYRTYAVTNTIGMRERA